MNNKDSLLDQSLTTGAPLQRVFFGINGLDEELHGLRPGSLCVILGEKCVGKSILALQAALNAAVLNNMRAVILTLEGHIDMIVWRSVAHVSGVSMQRIRKEMFSANDLSRLAAAREKLRAAPLVIADRHWDISQIVRQCKRQKAEDGLSLAVVDYVQLLSSLSVRKDGGNRDCEVADITRKLKQLARELDVAVIAVSQIDDDGEPYDFKPLRDAADVTVCIECDEQDENQPERRIRIRKNRNGAAGVYVPVSFYGEYMTFEDRPAYPYVDRLAA